MSNYTSKVITSFVYHNDNLEDLIVVIQDLYDSIGGFSNLKKKHFCFLPRPCTDNDSDDNYHKSNLAITQAIQYREKVNTLMQMANAKLRDFIKSYANIETPLQINETISVSHCGMVANYILLAADGNLYPCCVAAIKQQAALGSMGSDLYELYKRRLSFWENTPASFCKKCRLKNTRMGKRVWGKWS